MIVDEDAVIKVGSDATLTDPVPLEYDPIGEVWLAPDDHNPLDGKSGPAAVAQTIGEVLGHLK